MYRKVVPELNIELDERIHRYRYASSLYDHDLRPLIGYALGFGVDIAYPDVGKGWAERF